MKELNLTCVYVILDKTITKGLVDGGLIKVIESYLRSPEETQVLSSLGIALNLLDQGYGEKF